MNEIIPGSAFADRREIQDNIRSEYGEWIPANQIEWFEGEWIIDGMDPYEWADSVFGDTED